MGPMSKREIAAIIVLLIVGFVAYEVIRGFNPVDFDEVAPGESPDTAGSAGETPQTAEVKALVPAARASELFVVAHERYGIPELPPEAGVLAIAGNPGEVLFTRHYPGRSEVCVMRASGLEVLWVSEGDGMVEIVGSHGAELLLKFVEEPFDGPADAWQPGGFFGLDMFAWDAGVHPVELDDATVDDLRRLIR